MRKRLIYLLLAAALVLITACSESITPPATESPAASETTTPISIQTPTLLPDYMPPLDFEVASVWKAEAFGEGGKALIYMSEIVDGTFSFKLYMYQYIHERGADFRSILMDQASSTAFIDSDKYRFSMDPVSGYSLGGIGIIYLDMLTGAISLSDETLKIDFIEAGLLSEGILAEYNLSGNTPSISYIDASWDPGSFTIYLPKRFTRMPDDEAGLAMYEMPMLAEEVVFPPAGTFNWDNGVFSSTDPDCIPNLRGISIGDHILDVIARFPCELEDYNRIFDEVQESDMIMLYGNTDFFPANGIIFYENAIPKEIRYGAGNYVAFYLNEELCVNEIKFAFLLH